MAKETSAAVAQCPDALKAVEAAQGASARNDILEKLRASVAGYVKQSKNAIDMADGDAGSAHDVHQGRRAPLRRNRQADRSADRAGSESKDREVARAGPGSNNSSGCYGDHRLRRLSSASSSRS